MPPPIVVKNLTFKYPSVRSNFEALMPRRSKVLSESFALNNLSFQINRTERVALIGENGSGKTTLLKILARIYYPQKGLCNIEGKIMTLFNVGLGSRHELSGIENIKLQCLMSDIPSKEIPSYIKKVVEFSELSHVINDPMKTYSAGMSMRLQFAIATTLSPEILLLDEWIGAGDKAFHDKATARLNKFIASSSTFILASHNVHIVKKYCTRAIWLKDGKIVQDGDVETVLKEYNHYIELKEN